MRALVEIGGMVPIHTGLIRAGLYGDADVRKAEAVLAGDFGWPVGLL